MKSLTAVIASSESVDVLSWDKIINNSLLWSKVRAIEDRTYLSMDMSVTTIDAKRTALALKFPTLSTLRIPHFLDLGKPVVVGKCWERNSANFLLSGHVAPRYGLHCCASSSVSNDPSL